MKKESFMKLIGAVQKQAEREGKLTYSLSDFFDGNFICEISTGLQTTILEVLETEMDDPEVNSKHGSVIQWWLFDAPGAGKNIEAAYLIDQDEQTIPLETAGQLFDYLDGLKSTT